MLPLLLAVAAFLCAMPAFAENPEARPPDWHGYERLDFTVADRAALIVRPKAPAPGRPWIWRTEFFGHEPQADIALLDAGWHVAYYKVSDMYGSPKSIALMVGFHAHATREYGLHQRAVLEGFSRGGLYAVNFAVAHPTKTAALYLDAPVLTITSWPGGKGTGTGAPNLWSQALAAYELTEESVETFRGNPLDQVEKLAQARIPIITVCGDADRVVPYLENTEPFARRYRELGGPIEVIVKPGIDHHPHSLKDPAPIVEFLLKNAYQN